MVAVPGATAVTFPLLFTVATEEFDVDHLMDLFVALLGLTEALRVCVFPAKRVIDLVFMETEVLLIFPVGPDCEPDFFFHINGSAPRVIRIHHYLKKMPGRNESDLKTAIW